MGDPPPLGCSRCADGGTCRSCAQRRKQAWRLVEQRGLSYGRAAARMRLTPAQVRLLVFRERDHQDLQRFKLDLIPTERVRALIDRFDDPLTPYLAVPSPRWAPRFSDYRHLERIAESETAESETGG